MYGQARLPVCVVASILVAVMLPACGEDEDESVSKEQYVQRVNEKCRDRVAEAEELFESYGTDGPEPGSDEFEQAVEELVDMNRDMIEFIDERPWPAGDEEVLARIVSESDEATDELEEHFEGSSGPIEDPYAAVNEELDEYGLTSCTD